MNAFLAQLKAYKYLIILVLFIIYSIGIFIFASNIGELRVQKDFDDYKIKSLEDINKSNNKILEEKNKRIEEANKYINEDIKKSRLYAEERLKLNEQAEKSRNTLNNLLKDPRYKSCRLDNETLKEINKRIKDEKE